MPDPASHERDRYLAELLDTTLKTVERVVRRMDREASEDRETLNHLLHELRKIEHDLHPPTPPPPQLFPTSTRFTETTMLPTEDGNTLVFTGTFVPAGSVPPTDAQYAATSNDSAVSPTVDSTGLIVTIPLPTGWVENPDTPLVITRTASSVSVPSWTLSDVITPSAPPAPLPTSTTFVQTT